MWCRGLLSASLSSTARPIHNNTHKSTHTHSLALAASGASCFPNPLSEHGLTNTSSNESHHHDHDHATMSLLFIFNNFCPNRATFPPSGFSYPAPPKVSGLGRACGLAGCIGFSSAPGAVAFSGPSHVCICVCLCVVWCASLFHLESAGPWIHSPSLYAIFLSDHHLLHAT